jgi:hypothetical protein
MNVETAPARISQTRQDRPYRSRIGPCDRGDAGSVAALLWLARLTGRDEAVLTSRQLDIVLGALGDAIAYRDSGVNALGCWDCENVPGGKCAEHARNADTARVYAELASALSARLTQGDQRQPAEIAG